ncbi:hypothetical protein BASA50_007238 [Batrachochytrium salamandrivorans]|uniref:Aquaporin n=1 Tax=Batrachochytrium salamandrivorans TaxID=1357716 RepID=A0ABQ8FAF2_9FUNG|nr:hypothetical protein BASA62_010296 [Batrachochytrium salamandrivorans]KAH6593569.1 hypothetical protein BASA50_007238 [Batrachochytrium salamandrivorans]KAH6601478.1 hypothetical protein BASA61_001961 [Batrachochytrium salamandrivorans]KAH9256554.1 hypothetical protein BASA81_005243 [Batrachochytrium salamandrivorans]KAH9263190.1 hypothetical protein BASA83_013473 [Batrachochytrium salamandrivorans]
MVDFKKSEFSEIESHPIDIETSPAPETSDMSIVPIEERFSWNPYDWYLGIRREIQEFSFTIDEKKRVMFRAIFGEGLVTFLFLFIVEATAVNNGRQANPENLVLGALSTSLASVALIYSFADVSGAHFNPAVTFATIITGKVSVRKGLAFISIQLIASVIATLFLFVVFPGVGGNGVTSIPSFLVVDIDSSAHIVQAFFMELILTFILVYVIFATAFDTVDTKGVKVNTGNGERDQTSGNNLTIYTTSGTTKAGFAPLAIGFTLGFLGLIGGTVSGGAFNPARAFGPTLISGQGWTHHWIYWVGDLTGAALAGWAQHLFAHEAVQKSSAVRTRTGAIEDARAAAALAKSASISTPINNKSA